MNDKLPAWLSKGCAFNAWTVSLAEQYLLCKPLVAAEPRRPIVTMPAYFMVAFCCAPAVCLGAPLTLVPNARPWPA